MIAEVKAAYRKLGMTPKPHIPTYGSLAITVPGAVDGWGALHDKFGKLPMADDLAPAIALCAARLSGDAAHRAVLERQHDGVRAHKGR